MIGGECGFGGQSTYAATYFGFARELGEVQEEDATGEVSGRDGSDHAVVGVGGVDRAALPEGGQWACSGGTEHHAAYLLSPALVQPVRPGSRRGAVRFAGIAPFCGRGFGPSGGAR